MSQTVIKAERVHAQIYNILVFPIECADVAQVPTLTQKFKAFKTSTTPRDSHTNHQTHMCLKRNPERTMNHRYEPETKIKP